MINANRHLSYLESAGLVRLLEVQPELSYFFRHALVQDATYNALLKTDRRQIHQKVGQALQQLYSDRVDELAPVLAWHFFQAGEYHQAVRYFSQAGDRSAAVYANDEAIGHYQQGLLSARKLDYAVAVEQVQHLYIRCGRVLELQARFVDALSLYQEMETIGREKDIQSLELASLMAQATIRVTANIAFDPEKGRALLEQAVVIAQATNDRAAEAKILWNFVWLGSMQGADAEEIIDFGERSLAISRELGLWEQVALARNDLWYGYSRAGQWEQAQAGLLEAAGIWRELNNLPLLAESLKAYSLMAIFRGNFEEAVRYGEESFEVGRDSHNLDAQALSHFLLEIVFLSQGKIEKAIQVMEESVVLGEPVNNLSILVACRANLGWLYGWLGMRQKGFELLEAAEALAREKFPVLLAWPLVQKGYLLLYGGEWEALAELLTVIGDYRAVQQAVGFMPYLWARVALLAIESALAQEQLEEAAVLLDDLYNNLRQKNVIFVVPDVLYLQGYLALVRGQLAEAGEKLVLAQQKAEELGSKRLLWPIFMAFSRLAWLEGRPETADDYRHRAAGIVDAMADEIDDPLVKAAFLAQAAVKNTLQEGGYQEQGKYLYFL